MGQPSPPAAKDIIQTLRVYHPLSHDRDNLSLDFSISLVNALMTLRTCLDLRAAAQANMVEQQRQANIERAKKAAQAASAPALPVPVAAPGKTPHSAGSSVSGKISSSSGEHGKNKPTPSTTQNTTPAASTGAVPVLASAVDTDTSLDHGVPSGRDSPCEVELVEEDRSVFDAEALDRFLQLIIPPLPLNSKPQEKNSLVQSANALDPRHLYLRTI